MNFHMSVWHKYRKQASIIGNHIDSYKNNKGVILLEKKILEGYIQQITDILKECNEYMDKCGLTPTPILWKYNVKDPTTHPSNKAFIYKDRMTKQAIKAYGSGFMFDDLKEAKAD